MDRQEKNNKNRGWRWLIALLILLFLLLLAYCAQRYDDDPSTSDPDPECNGNFCEDDPIVSNGACEGKSCKKTDDLKREERCAELNDQLDRTAAYLSSAETLANDLLELIPLEIETPTEGQREPRNNREKNRLELSEKSPPSNPLLQFTSIEQAPDFLAKTENNSGSSLANIDYSSRAMQICNISQRRNYSGPKERQAALNEIEELFLPIGEALLHGQDHSESEKPFKSSHPFANILNRQIRDNEQFSTLLENLRKINNASTQLDKAENEIADLRKVLADNSRKNGIAKECLTSLENRLGEVENRINELRRAIETVDQFVSDLLESINSTLPEILSVLDPDLAPGDGDISSFTKDDLLGSSGYSSEDHAAFDQALNCREAAYAASTCDPSFIEKYGRENCSHELAMAGISWDGLYPGDAGKHLRWFFRTTEGVNGAAPLSFPEGFNLYRRVSATGSWTRINTTGPIKPVESWNDPASSSSQSWQPKGKDRLPNQLHGDYTGTNADQFDNLIEMLGYEPYNELHYVEGVDKPFTDEASADAHRTAQGETLLTWSMQPMGLMMMTSMHSQVARLLGLYFIDKDADENVLHDYLIEGIWDDRHRYFLLEDISNSTTQPLPRPTLEKTNVLRMPAQEFSNGDFWPTEAAVQLRWKPPTNDPEEPFTDPETIDAVMYQVERSDFGELPSPKATGTAFALTKQLDDNFSFIDAEPVMVIPEDDEVSGVAKWPEYFGFDKYVDYHRYQYRIRGVDFFGRTSQPSNSLQVDVTDQYAPVAPINVKAAIHQRDDKSILRASDYNDLFPDGSKSAHEFVLRVSWFWPSEFAKTAPDLDQFRIYYKFTDFENFSQKTELWPETTNWDGWASGQARFSVPGVAGVVINGSDGNEIGRQYEFLSYIDPDDLLTPELLNQIAADDDNPVVYGYVTVAAEDVRQNIGSTSGPVTVFTRDLTPPPPPAPPQKIFQSTDMDARGNVTLKLETPSADVRYTYNLFRVPQRKVSDDANSFILPANCSPDVNDSENVDGQIIASMNPGRYTQLTSKALSPSNSGSVWTVPYTDRVDGTISQVFYYAAQAIDAAGNVSDLSCPSDGIKIIDSMPPRAPVFSSVSAGDGEITLKWTKNFEEDLSHYELYSTVDTERLISKRKMAHILSAEPNGRAITQTPGIPTNAEIIEELITSGTNAGQTAKDWLQWTDVNLRSGQDYHYRLVAVDISGNASEMSQVVTSRPYDETPPSAPDWDASAGITDSTNTDGMREISLKWELIAGDEDARFLIQRKAGSFPAWMTLGGWLDPGTTTFTDTQIAFNESYEYRIRAMDVVGNKSDWSDTILTSP